MPHILHLRLGDFERRRMAGGQSAEPAYFQLDIALLHGVHPKGLWVHDRLAGRLRRRSPQHLRSLEQGTERRRYSRSGRPVRRSRVGQPLDPAQEEPLLQTAPP